MEVDGPREPKLVTDRPGPGHRPDDLVVEAVTLSRTGLRFTIDTHIIDDPSPGVRRLREFADDRELQLSASDKILVEVEEAKPERRAELQELVWRHDVYLGPWVMDHSLIGHCVLASDEDTRQVREVFDALFPSMLWSSARKQDVRDALHVQTAIRYARDGFITRDKALIKARGRVRDAFNHFLILSPEEAVQQVEKRIRQHRKLEALRRRPRLASP